MTSRIVEFRVLEKSFAYVSMACDAVYEAKTFALRPVEEELAETARNALQELKSRLMHRALDMTKDLEKEMEGEE